MACTDCKGKKENNKEAREKAAETPSWVIWTTITMVILAIHGLISLIHDLFQLLR